MTLIGKKTQARISHEKHEKEVHYGNNSMNITSL
jgi:hypothetical protein